MTEAAGVVVPVHNEQELLPRCLAALDAAVAAAAARSPTPRVHIVVALDACTDASPEIAQRAGVDIVLLQACNVGLARAAAVRRVLELERWTPRGRIWIATTDADSAVPADWLTRQLDLAAAGASAVVGTVEADGWDGHDPHVAAAWTSRYYLGGLGRYGEPHRHVHGANLGCNAAAYLAAGGFLPLRTGEDVALLQALTARVRPIIQRPRDLVVATSTRRQARAPGGFGAYLNDLDQGSGPRHPLRQETAFGSRPGP